MRENMLESNDAATHEFLGVQFDDLVQQQSTASLGMWLFLATEVLFFGGLFMAYTAYRVSYPQAFAEAGKELNITIGTINTAVLLISSYFMALAVNAIKKGLSRKSAIFLACTWILGFIFLCLKAYEYYDDIEKHIVPGVSTGYSGPNVPVGRMLYFIYYAMTGVHALHLTIGLSVVAVVFLKTLRGKFSAAYHSPIEVTGLYWHFVDMVWIFLYPLLYLMDRHS
jgi:cytochrome c oxidase subunit III